MLVCNYIFVNAGYLKGFWTSVKTLTQSSEATYGSCYLVGLAAGIKLCLEADIRAAGLLFAVQWSELGNQHQHMVPLHLCTLLSGPSSLWWTPTFSNPLQSKSDPLAVGHTRWCLDCHKIPDQVLVLTVILSEVVAGADGCLVKHGFYSACANWTCSNWMWK